MDPKNLEQLLEFGKFAGTVISGAAITAGLLSITIHYLIKYQQGKYSKNENKKHNNSNYH